MMVNADAIAIARDVLCFIVFWFYVALFDVRKFASGGPDHSLAH
jgi:hypothetical protein